MTKHHFLYPLLGLALLCCGVYIARQEISQARAEERSKASAETIKQIEQVRQQKDAELEAARKQPATIQTVTKYLPLPLPAKSEIKLETLPDAPTPQLVLTGDAQENLKAIQDMEIAHLKCDNDLGACQKDYKEMTADRDTWKNTAKGGSKWKRALKIAKCGAVAGGGAGLGALLGKSKGAAIGGFAGSAGCMIFW